MEGHEFEAEVIGWITDHFVLSEIEIEDFPFFLWKIDYGIKMKKQCYFWVYHLWTGLSFSRDKILSFMPPAWQYRPEKRQGVAENITNNGY